MEALELWRQEVGLTKFTLLGHSFGGFISARYALKAWKAILPEPRCFL